MLMSHMDSYQVSSRIASPHKSNKIAGFDDASSGEDTKSRGIRSHAVFGTRDYLRDLSVFTGE